MPTRRRPTRNNGNWIMILIIAAFIAVITAMLLQIKSDNKVFAGVGFISEPTTQTQPTTTIPLVPEKIEVTHTWDKKQFEEGMVVLKSLNKAETKIIYKPPPPYQEKPLPPRDVNVNINLKVDVDSTALKLKIDGEQKIKILTSQLPPPPTPGKQKNECDTCGVKFIDY